MSLGRGEERQGGHRLSLGGQASASGKACRPGPAQEWTSLP